jgi:hypothetical protein
MTILEKPDTKKVIAGIILCIISALTTNFILGPDPDSTSIFWFIPGLIFGLALILPNIFDIIGTKWKIISILTFPVLTIAVWVFNVFLAWTIGGAISSVINLTVGILFIGFISAFNTAWAFNFFFQHQIKMANYLVIGLLGSISFLVTDKVFLSEGQGMTNHFDKLIYAWQPLVGFGISLTFKKESLEIFIK